MKNLIKLAFFLLPLSVFSIMLFFACQKDPCENVTCQNLGTCEGNGQCKCPEGFIGNFCEKEQTPSVAILFSVNIFEYPTTRQNGTGWDPLDGPDIIVQLLNANTKSPIYTQANPINDITPNRLPLTIGIGNTLRITDVTTPLNFYLFDFDSFSSNELMAAALFFPYEKGKAFPKDIEIGGKGTGFWAKINVIYQF